MKKIQSSGKPNHIGWDLWQTTSAWKDRYTQEMVKRGFDWYGEARSNLLQHIPAQGIAQAEIVAQSNLTKQAVQQLLDELEKDDVIKRIADPNDSRRKKVILAKHGVQAFRAANRVKIDIEKEYRKLLGNRAFDELEKSLKKIVEHETT